MSESPNLTWSSTPPTQPGWYWAKLPTSTHPQPMEFRSDFGTKDGLYMNLDPIQYGTGAHIDLVVERMKGIQWCGPIPEEFVPKV